MQTLSKQPDFISGLDRLSETSPELTDSFIEFRAKINHSGPLDPKQRELCMLAGFTVARNEGGFRVHCTHAAAAGATLDEVNHTVLMMFGSNLGLFPIVETLQWAREEFEGISGKEIAKR